MATIPSINKFDDLLQPIIKKTSKVVSYETKHLTAPGENYGSLLIAVEALIQNDDNSTEKVNFVAKLCPPNEWLKRMFASQVTFKKEIGFYMEIIPTLVEFQKEHNIPEKNLLNTLFPKCLNGRINLNPDSDCADDDAILMLENLKLSNYNTLNRLVGINYDETVIVLKSLARFHAVPLAYKIKNPDDFKNKLMPLLNRVVIGLEMMNTVQDKFIECIYRHLNLNKDKLNRFINGMRKGFEFQKNFPTGSELYATIVHCDFWTNNTMLKLENNVPIDNKMVDFQVSTYGSPATDVAFFLYTSVEQNILDEHYDNFLRIYHSAFVNCLQELHCDETEYTFESFLNEINRYGSLEASHILIMCKPIFTIAEEKDLDNMTIDDMFTDVGVTDIYKNRLIFTVNKFFDKNWF